MSAQIHDSIDNDDDITVLHGTPDADGVVAEAIQHGNRKMLRYSAQCNEPGCEWVSHHYAKHETAALIATEHKENTCLPGRRRSKRAASGATPHMQATTLFRTGALR